MNKGVRKGVRWVFFGASIFYRTLDRTLSGQQPKSAFDYNNIALSGQVSGAVRPVPKSVCPSGGVCLRTPPYGHSGN